MKNKNILLGLFSLLMIGFLILLVGSVSVSAITWRHSGTDTMSLSDAGDLNVLGNITGSWFKGLWNGSSDYYLNSNPFSFWNNTYATFNKTYADTLYSGIEWDYNQTTPAVNKILSWSYYNSTDFSIGNYYLKSNPFSYYNSTNPQTETDPKWTDNFTKYNATWSSTHASTADYATSASSAEHATYANSALRALYLGDSFRVTANNLGDLQVNNTGNSWFVGNLGIGTTDPSTKLQVIGIINASQVLINGSAVLTSYSNTWWGLNEGYIYNNSDSLDFNETRLNTTIDARAVSQNMSVGGGWSNTSTTTSTSLDVNVGSGDLFVNSTSGRVGIGMTSPKNSLNVVGDINATTNIYGNVIYESETSLINKYYQLSDPFNFYNSTDFNISDYFTQTLINSTFFNRTQITDFNYYNSTDFSISDYYTKTQIDNFDYYNASDFNIADYYTSSQTDTAIQNANTTVVNWIDALFPRITELVGLLGNWSADKSDYYTSTQTDTAIGNANTTMKGYVDAQDTAFNTSLKNYVDTLDTATNTTMKSYVDSQDTVFNTSMKTYVDGTFLTSYTETDPKWTDNFTKYNATWSSTHASTADYATSASSAEHATYANSALRALYLGDSFRVTANNLGDLQVNNTGNSWFVGNLGIGTTTPQQKLHVNGSAVINGTLNMDSNKITSLANATSAQDAVALSQLQEVNNTMSGDFVPYTGSSANVDLGAHNFTVDTNVFHIDKDTNRVGIGTTTPSYPLDVKGNIRTNASLMSGGFSGFSLYDDSNFYILSSNHLQYLESYQTSGDLFYIYQTDEETLTGATNFLRIDADESPMGNQDVTGIKVEMPASYGSGTEYAGYFSGDNRVVALVTDTAAIYTDGDVGLGIADPKNTLNVIGDINATTNIYGTTLYEAGTSLTNKYYQKSNPFGFYNSTNPQTEAEDPKWTANYSARTGTGAVVFGTSPTFTTGIIVPADSISDDELNEGATFEWTAAHTFGASAPITMASGTDIRWVDTGTYIDGTATGMIIESDDTLVMNADTSAVIDSPDSAFTGTLMIGEGKDFGLNVLRVLGDINATTNISTPKLCLDGDCQTTWPAGGGGGGWTNDTVTTSTGLNVNLTSGNLTIVDGRLGIGTNSPIDKLEVLDTTSGGGGLTTGLLRLGKFSDGSSINARIQHYFNTSVYIGLNSEGQGIYFMGGAVGIGTTTPKGIFNIAGNIMDTGEPFINISYSSSPFIIDDAGKVGIGTYNPSQKLEISNSTQGLTISPNGASDYGALINTTGSKVSNVTITSSGGSVIIQLG